MSKVIEERVVQMDFDNAKFEKKTAESMKTIQNLKNVFKGFDKTKETFNNLEHNMNSLANNVKENSNKMRFSINGVMSDISTFELTVLNVKNNVAAYLASMASDITKKLAKPIQNAKAGFEEYETQINAVQTILANTASAGTTLKQVTDALDELNKYADLTIYNFTEMTRNIGTFTAAGIDLDTSVSAIQGIANLAAVSGSTSQQASTAMYQLSQALAAGTVKLQDWNSVVNAGMGGQVFQDALKETARLHGIAIDQMIEEQGSFRESLQKGWITADLLTETLKKFTTSGVNEYLAKYTNRSVSSIATMRKAAIASGKMDKEYRKMAKSLSESCDLTEEQVYQMLNMSTTAEDAATKVKTFKQLMDTLNEAMQSGWTQTWELIVGDFEQAKELFTDLSNRFGSIIERVSNARNSFIESVLESPWDKLNKEFQNAGISFSQFEQAVTEVAKKNGSNIEAIIEQYGDLKTAIMKGAFNLKHSTVSQALSDMMATMTDTKEAAYGLFEPFNKFATVVDRVAKVKVGYAEARQKALTEAGYDYAMVADIVRRRIDGEVKSLNDLSEAELIAIGYTDKQIEALRVRNKMLELGDSDSAFNKFLKNLKAPEGRALIVDTLRNSLEALQRILESVGRAWNAVFKPVNAEIIYDILLKINEFSKKLVLSEEKAEALKKSFQGLFIAIKYVGTAIANLTRGVFSKMPFSIGKVTVHIYKMVKAFLESILSFESFQDAMYVIVGAIYTVGEKINALTEIVVNSSFSFRNFGVYASLGINIVTEAVSRLVSMIGNLKGLNFGSMKKTLGAFAGSSTSSNSPTPRNSVQSRATPMLLSEDSWIDPSPVYFSDSSPLTRASFSSDVSSVSAMSRASNQNEMAQTIANYKERQERQENLAKWYKNFIGIITKSLSIFKNAVTSTIQGIKELKQTGIDSFLSKIRNTDTSKPFSWFESIVSIIDKKVAHLAETLNVAKDKLAAFSSKLKDIFEKIVDYSKKNYTLQEAIAALLAFKLVATLENITKFFDFFPKLGRNVDKFMKIVDRFSVVTTKAINKIAGSISGVFKAASFNIRADSLLKLAAALSILVLNFIFLASVPKESMGDAVKSLIAISAILTAMSFILAKLLDEDLIMTLSLSFIALTWSIKSLIDSLKLITTLVSSGNMADAVLPFGIIAASLIGTVLLISKSEVKKSAIIAGANMLIIGTCLSLFVKSIKEISELNIKGAFAAVVEICMLITTLGVMFKLLEVSFPKAITNNSKTGKFKFLFSESGENTLIKMGIGLGALSAGLVMLARSMKVLAKLNSKEIARGFNALNRLVTLFMVSILTIKFAGKFSHTIGVMVLGIAASINMLMVPILILGAIPADYIEKSIRILSQMFIMYGMFYAFTRDSVSVLGKEIVSTKSSIGKISKTLTALGMSVLSITGALIIIGALPLKMIGKGLLGVISIMTSLAVFLRIGKKLELDNKMVVGLAIAVGSIAATMIILSILPWENIGKGVASLTAITGALSGIFLSMSKVTKKYTKGVVAMTVLIGVIGSVLLLLSTFTDTKDALRSAGAISAVMLAVSGSVYIISKNDKMQFKKCIGILAMMVAMMGIAYGLVFALTKMEGLQAYSMSKLVVGIAAVLASFGYIVKSINGFEIKQGFWKTFASITAIVVTFSAIATGIVMALKLFGGDIPLYTTDMISLGILLVSLTTMVYILSKIKPEATKSASKVIKSFSIMLLAVAALAGTCMLVLNGLWGLDVSNKTIIQLLELVGGIAALALGITAVLSKLPDVDYKKAITLSTIMAGLSIVVVSVANSLDVARGIDIKDAGILLGVVTYVSLLGLSIAKIASKFKNKDIDKAVMMTFGIFTICMAFATIATAISVLENIDVKSTAIVTGVFTLISGIVVALAAITSKMTTWKKTATFATSLGVVMASMVGIIEMISYVLIPMMIDISSKSKLFDSKTMGILLEAMTVLGAITVGIGYIVGKFPKDLSLEGVLIGILGTYLMLQVIVAVLQELQLMYYSNVFDMEALEGVGIWITKVSEIFGNVLGSFYGSIAYTVIEKVANGIQYFIKTLQPCIWQMSMLPDNIVDKTKSFISAVSMLAFTSIGLGILKQAFKVLDLKGLKDDTFDLSPFIKMAEQINEFDNTLRDDIDLSKIDKAAEILLKLHALEAEITAFGVGKGIYNNIANVSNTPLSFLGSGILGTLSGMKGLPKADSTLSTFGTDIKALADALDGIDDYDLNVENMNKIVSCAEKFLAVNNSLSKSGPSLMTWIMGQKDLSKFGEGIGHIGEGMYAFSEAINKPGFDVDLVANAGEAAILFADLENSLPPLNGVLQKWIMGQQDLDKFSESLPKLGTALYNFCLAIKGQSNANRMLSGAGNALTNIGDVLSDGVFDENTVKSAAAAAECLSALESGLTGHDGLLQLLLGDADLATFGNGLADLAIGLRSISAAGASFNMDSLDAVTTVVNLMSDLDKMLQNENGTSVLDRIQQFIDPVGTAINNKLNPNNAGSINTISKVIEEIGFAVGSFYSTFDKLSYDDLTKYIDAFSLLMNNIILAKTTDAVSSSDDIVKLFKSFSSAGSDVASFYKNMEGIDVLEFGVMVNHLRQLVGFTNNLTEDKVKLLNEFAYGLHFLSESDFNNLIERFNNDGATIVQAISDGITSNFNVTNTALESILIAASEDVILYETNESKMYTAGMYMVAGFAEGVRLNSYMAEQAALYMANNVINTVNVALDEHSPSKEGNKQGAFYVEGIVDGIVDMYNKSKDVISGVFNSFISDGDSVISSVVSGFSSMSEKLTGIYQQINEQGLGNTIASWKNNITSFFGNFIENMPTSLGDAVESLKEKGKQLIGSITEEFLPNVQGTLEHITEEIQNGLEDITPTIAPEIDTSAIESGTDFINGALGSITNPDLSTSLSGINNISQALSGYNKDPFAALNDTINNLLSQQQEPIVNNFNITGDDPKLIATMVINKLNKQVERRNSTWA